MSLCYSNIIMSYERNYIINNFHFRMCSGPKRTDFDCFKLSENVVLEALILNNFQVRRGGGLVRSDFE